MVDQFRMYFFKFLNLFFPPLLNLSFVLSKEKQVTFVVDRYWGIVFWRNRKHLHGWPAAYLWPFRPLHSSVFWKIKEIDWFQMIFKYQAKIAFRNLLNTICMYGSYLFQKFEKVKDFKLLIFDKTTYGTFKQDLF